MLDIIHSCDKDVLASANMTSETIQQMEDGYDMFSVRAGPEAQRQLVVVLNRWCHLLQTFLLSPMLPCIVRNVTFMKKIK